jgi:hypothetical protein
VTELGYSTLSLLASYLGAALITVFVCPFIFKGINKEEEALLFAFMWPFLIIFGVLSAVGYLIKITFGFVFNLGKLFRELIRGLINGR